jgi:hypothetical protein
VAKWYFDVNLFSDLVDKGFLTQNEYDLLVQVISGVRII